MSRAGAFWGECRQMAASPHWRITAVLIALVTVFYYAFCDSRGCCTQYFFFELRHHFIGLLYLVPFVYATLSLGLAGAIASWTIGFAALAPRLSRYFLGFDALTNNIGNLGLPFLIAIVVLLELRWRERHRQIAIERENERRMHIERVFGAQESERRRISQGLHDDVLQRLLSIAYMAESLGSTDPYEPESIQTQAFEIRNETIRLSDELRRLSYDLRPSILDNLGLVPAVNWLSVRLRKETGINIKVVTRGAARRLSDAVETTAFRIAQESLNNVARHSHATDAVVTLHFHPDCILLDVTDNGVGFASAHTMEKAVLDGHLGILGMRERVASLNGTLTIKARPAEGTRIKVRLPIEAEAAPVEQQ